jgi:hypothetical protein
LLLREKRLRKRTLIGL